MDTKKDSAPEMKFDEDSLDGSFKRIFDNRFIITADDAVEELEKIDQGTQPFYRNRTEEEKTEVAIQLPLPPNRKHEVVKRYLKCHPNIPRDERTMLYSEIGLASDGKPKGKTCWVYVKNLKCQHTKKEVYVGTRIGEMYHPAGKEREYLLTRQKKK